MFKYIKMTCLPVLSSFCGTTALFRYCIGQWRTFILGTHCWYYRGNRRWGLSGSQIGVSGPAAGLAAIVLTAIGTLGAIKTFWLP